MYTPRHELLRAPPCDSHSIALHTLIRGQRHLSTDLDGGTFTCNAFDLFLSILATAWCQVRKASVSVGVR